MTEKLRQQQTLTIKYDQKFDNDEPYRLNMTKKYIIMFVIDKMKCIHIIRRNESLAQYEHCYWYLFY